MTWKWEELTAPQFARAVEEVKGVCIVPLGVLEKHGDHLPLGTDGLVISAIAERAAAIEPAIIFPTCYWGQIMEARQWPGTLAIRHQLLFALLENTCEEIARNGCRKIVLLNGHGGNEALLSLFAFTMLERRREFVAYIAQLGHYMSPVLDSPEWNAMMESDFDDHAGEIETSTMMAVNPALVRMADLSAPALPQKRLAHLPARTPMWWYADFPDHYAGDATHATPDKGEFLLRGYSEKVAEIIKAVKEDREAERLQEEFFARTEHY